MTGMKPQPTVKVEQPIIGIHSSQVKPFQPQHFSRPTAVLSSRPWHAMKLIDVSVPIDASLPTYPGNTPFSLEPIKRLARGDSSNVSTLHMSAHSGTHVDAPRHFYDNGPSTEALPLEMLVGRARVIEVISRSGVTAEELAAQD